MNTFEACEMLIKKHAPLLMRVGYDEPRQYVSGRIPSAYRPPIPGKTINRMKKLRAQGKTIWDIARAVQVTWKTAWRHSKNNTQ
jgi:hypothetical protein